MRIWLVNSALDSVECRMNCADNNHATGLWNYLLDASWYRVDSRLVTIDGLGMLLKFLIKSLLSALWLVDDSAAVSLRYVLTRDRMTTFFVFFQLEPSVVLPAVLPCHLMVDTCALLDIRTSQAIDLTPCSSNSFLTDPNLLYCGHPFGSGASFPFHSSPKTVSENLPSLPKCQ